MKVKSLGKNQTEVHTSNMIILISYETPVAMIHPIWNESSTIPRMLKTEEFHSVTTSKHINQWFKNMGFDPNTVKTRPQEFFTDLLGY